MAFAPFAPMLWLSIVFSVIYAVTGIGTAKEEKGANYGKNSAAMV